jgi:hypothetical protein
VRGFELLFYNAIQILVHYLKREIRKKLPKQRKKQDLPQKTCAACGRPFSWRKKWEKVWEEVKYCSDRCKRHKKTQLQ